MIRAVALVALPLLLLLPGCGTDRTELLVSPYCPTKIDIFGGADVLLSGTGGPTQGPRDITKGFDDGSPGFNQTLAGRLQLALLADAEIVRRVGASIRVRACAAPFASVSSFTNTDVSEPCQNGPPDPGGLADTCTSDPAPVAIVIASEMGDHCHGGDFAPTNDMPAAYADHLAARLQNFLVERRTRGPLFAFIGPQTHWEPMPRPMNMGMGLPDSVTCTWRLPHWTRLGVEAWRQATHPNPRDARIVGDLLDPFAARDDVCCAYRQSECVPNDPWLTKRDGSPLQINESGAQQIAKLWVDAVKGWMLGTQFKCGN